MVTNSAPDGDRSRIGWGVTLAILALVLLTRLPWLGVSGLYGDEDISTLVARGIAETGLPKLPSGNLYIRAPLYHYLVAPLTTFGIDWLPRLASVVISAITCLVVIRLGRRSVGNRAALVGGILYAISLTEIIAARKVRMYSLYELLALLAILALYRFWIEGGIRWGVISGLAVIVTLGAHQLGVTLGVLFLLVILRHASWRTRVAAVVSFASVLLISLWQQIDGARLFFGGLPAAPEPSETAFHSQGSGTLYGLLSKDPFALGVGLLGPSGLTAGLALMAVVGAVTALVGTRGRPLFTRSVAALGFALALGAAGLHQIGLAGAVLLLLILTRPELLPDWQGRRAILQAISVVGVVGAAWILVALVSGYGVGDVARGVMRWPGRYAWYFLWPPAIGILALAGAVGIAIRCWLGRPTGGERFLLIAIVLLASCRGLLTAKTQARFLVEIWPLWGLLAGWALVGALTWIGRVFPSASRKWAVGAAGLVFAAACALLPGTGVSNTLAFLRQVPGERVVTGPDQVRRVPDMRGVGSWLRPRLTAGDRVVATDWLSTYVYVGQVDGWIRWQGWGHQSVWLDGAVRDIYLHAEVLSDLDALQTYLAEGRTWVVVTELELSPGGEKMSPEARDWLLGLEPVFVGADGATRILLFDRDADTP